MVSGTALLSQQKVQRDFIDAADLRITLNRVLTAPVCRDRLPASAARECRAFHKKPLQLPGKSRWIVAPLRR
jgi:hypothetical protein